MGATDLATPQVRSESNLAISPPLTQHLIQAPQGLPE